MKTALIAVILMMYLIPVTHSELSENEMISIGQNELNNTIPLEYRSEFIFRGIGKSNPELSYDLTYRVYWQRYINGIIAVDDRFIITIDSASGNVLGKYSKISVNTSEIITTPDLSSDQTKWIASRKQWTLQRNPELQIRDKKLVWFLKLDNNCEATVDAKTGDAGLIDCPQGVSVLNPPVKFDSTQYFIETQLAWIIGVLVIISGAGFIYYRKWKK